MQAVLKLFFQNSDYQIGLVICIALLLIGLLIKRKAFRIALVIFALIVGLIMADDMHSRLTERNQPVDPSMQPYQPVQN